MKKKLKKMSLNKTTKRKNTILNKTWIFLSFHKFKKNKENKLKKRK